jgi:hypothetical protein
MDPAPHPRRADEHFGDGLLQTRVRIAGDQLDATHAAGDQSLQEGAPDSHILTRTDVNPEHLANTVRAHTVRHDDRHRDHTPTLANVLVSRIQPEIRVHRVQRSRAEDLRLLVEHRAQPTDFTLAESRDAQRLDQRLDLTRADALHVRLGDHRHQRLLRAPLWLQPAREVAALA